MSIIGRVGNDSDGSFLFGDKLFEVRGGDAGPNFNAIC